MNGERLFIDTNILVYAYDQDAGEKHVIAKNKIVELWGRPSPPGISIQVLQECYVNLLRKRVPVQQAREIVQDYLQWNVVPADSALLLEGIRMAERWKISYWDGAIIAAAKRTDAAVIWSEDLNDGQDYGGEVVVNPFKRLKPSR